MRHPIPLILALVAVLGAGGCSLRKSPQTKQTVELERIARAAFSDAPTSHELWNAQSEISPSTRQTVYTFGDAFGRYARVDVDEVGITRHVGASSPLKFSATDPILLCEECRFPEQFGSEGHFSEAARNYFLHIGREIWPSFNLDASAVSCYSNQTSEGMVTTIEARRTHAGVPIRDQICALFVQCSDGALQMGWSSWEADIPPPFLTDAMTQEEALDTFLSNETVSFLQRIERETAGATLDQFEITSKSLGRMYVTSAQSSPSTLNPSYAVGETAIPAYVFALDFEPTAGAGRFIIAEIWLDPSTGKLIGSDHGVGHLPTAEEVKEREEWEATFRGSRGRGE